MKLFNLKEYLENPTKEIITSDGRNVRIVCTNRKDSNYPIVALIELGDREVTAQYTKYGTYHFNSESESDLFFAPEKHEGWINVYGVGGGFRGGSIYPSKEDANEGKCLSGYITTIKIEWEE